MIREDPSEGREEKSPKADCCSQNGRGWGWCRTWAKTEQLGTGWEGFQWRVWEAVSGLPGLWAIVDSSLWRRKSHGSWLPTPPALVPLSQPCYRARASYPSWGCLLKTKVLICFCLVGVEEAEVTEKDSSGLEVIWVEVNCKSLYKCVGWAECKPGRFMGKGRKCLLREVFQENMRLVEVQWVPLLVTQEAYLKG